MKTVSQSDIPALLGLNPLTGEACAFSMRVLCDMNEAGCTLMAEFLGMATTTGFQKNWNSQVNGTAAVASIMIPYSYLPEMVRFALYRAGYQYVICHNGSVDCTAFNGDDPMILKNGWLQDVLNGQPFPDFMGTGMKLYRNPKSAAQPSVGSRNVHAFTGRAE